MKCESCNSADPVPRQRLCQPCTEAAGRSWMIANQNGQSVASLDGSVGARMPIEPAPATAKPACADTPLRLTKRPTPSVMTGAGFGSRAKSMHATIGAAPLVSADYLSSIVNWVCPECGGPMGGRSKEFQCLGQCGKDWRSVWESASVTKRTKPVRRGPCLDRSSRRVNTTERRVLQERPMNVVGGR